MNEMIDRVAKAIERRASERTQLNAWRDYASAAIEALREPTDEMGRAGGRLLETFNRNFEGEEAKAGEVFTTMIDAALKDT